MDEQSEIGQNTRDDDPVSLERLRAGDEREWQIVRDRVWNLAFASARKATPDLSLAEDGVSMALIEIYKEITDRRDAYANWKHLKARICLRSRGRVIDVIRKREREAAGLNVYHEHLKQEAESTLGAADQEEVHERLAPLGRVLNEKELQLFELRFSEGETFQAIADQLGEPLSTITARYRRALAKAKMHLDPDGSNS